MRDFIEEEVNFMPLTTAHPRTGLTSSIAASL